jgi:hypothetical protein
MKTKKPAITLAENLFAYNGLNPNDPHEIKLTVSLNDRARYNALSKERWAEGTAVTVTDIPTGKQWDVARANCGQGCFCAAIALPTGSITGVSLSPRELATVLAALSYFRANLDDIDALDMDHFKDGAQRLSAPEIEMLCRRLNDG